MFTVFFILVQLKTLLVNVRKLCVNFICDELFTNAVSNVLFTVQLNTPQECAHMHRDGGREQREDQPFLPECQ